MLSNIFSVSLSLSLNQPLPILASFFLPLIILFFIVFYKNNFNSNPVTPNENKNKNNNSNNDNEISNESYSSEFDYEKYGLTQSHGVVQYPQLHALPEEFKEWENLVSRLPYLNKFNKLSEAVNNLPLIVKDRDHFNKLLNKEGDIQLFEHHCKRVFLLLGMILHSLVNGPSADWTRAKNLHFHNIHSSTSLPSEESKEQNSLDSNETEVESDNKEKSGKIDSIPSHISQPFIWSCLELGLPPILTAVLDIWNWTWNHHYTNTHQIANYKPHDINPSNITIQLTMTGSSAEVGFHTVPAAMHMVSRGLYPLIWKIPNLLAEGDLEEIINILTISTQTLNEMRSIFGSVHKFVDMHDFFHLYRPLLAGFFNSPVLLEGISPEEVNGLNGISIKDNKVYAIAKGPSAGQSVFFILIDLMLGVVHKGDMALFQQEMKVYMPRKHTQLISDYHQKLIDNNFNLGVKTFIENLQKNMKADDNNNADLSQSLNDLLESYNHCCRALRGIREFHLGVASSYLKDAVYGTGSSSFRTLLKESIEQVEVAEKYF